MQTLESLRESRGVTKVAIANYLGVSRPTYDEYEDNPHKMRVETALAVAEFLGVDVNEIIPKTDSRPRRPTRWGPRNRQRKEG